MLDFTQPIHSRVAPSNTGNATLALIRTAYTSYLAAKAGAPGSSFTLRIDNTDKERSKPEYEKNIVETLQWLGLEWDNFFRQSERFERYKEVAIELLDTGWASKKEGAIVLNPQEWVESWIDGIVGKISLSNKDKEIVNNTILMRSDGSPTYHLASVADDVDYNINCIIRGQDHLANGFRHVHIYKALNKPLPQFFHTGLIFANGKKVSKRDGMSDMSNYKTYHPEAILNFVFKLGVGHPNPNIDKIHPLINKNTAISLFKECELKATKSSLDFTKLIWLNKRYAAK